MILPPLDVDFHLAPVVDPRDHIGTAHARMEVGAPHFSQPREFWVRPVRWVNFSHMDNLLVRPVEADDARLLLAIFAFEHDYQSDEITLPPNWEQGWKSERMTKPRLPFDYLARYWRHPTQPAAVRFLTDYPPVLHLLGDSEAHEFMWPPQYAAPVQLSFDELVNWPDHDFHEHIAQQFEDEQSQLHLMWEWLQMPRKERVKLFFGGAKADEFLDLMRCVLVSEAAHVPDIAEFGAQWGFLRRHGGIRRPEKRFRSVVIEKRPRVIVWEQALRAHFEALRTERVPAMMS